MSAAEVSDFAVSADDAFFLAPFRHHFLADFACRTGDHIEGLSVECEFSYYCCCTVHCLGQGFLPVGFYCHRMRLKVGSFREPRRCAVQVAASSMPWAAACHAFCFQVDFSFFCWSRCCSDEIIVLSYFAFYSWLPSWRKGRGRVPQNTAVESDCQK